MESTPSSAIALAVRALQRSHPDVPPLDLLDLVMQGRTGSVVDIADADRPESELGQALAVCFDRGMTPAEWRGLTGPTADPLLVSALREVWRDVVLAGFARRYELVMADAQHPSGSPLPARPLRRRAM